VTSAARRAAVERRTTTTNDQLDHDIELDDDLIDHHDDVPQSFAYDCTLTFRVTSTRRSIAQFEVDMRPTPGNSLGSGPGCAVQRRSSRARRRASSTMK